MPRDSIVSAAADAELAATVAAGLRNLTEALARLESPPFSIPLDRENEGKILARYGWHASEVRALARKHGLPLKRIGVGCGSRFVLLTAAVDRWLLDSPGLAGDARR